jgi:hypothetical protein
MESDTTMKWFLALVAFLLSAILIIAGDWRPISHINVTDYVSEYYVAGHMVASGSASQLYPPPGTTSIFGTPFENYERKLVVPLPPGYCTLFIYPPLTAVIFEPLSHLPPRQSLIVWQIINLLALAAGALIFSRYTGNTRSFFLLFSGSFISFVVMQNLLMGQTDLLFGLLPLIAGYVFWQRDKPLVAGLIWSLLWLKPVLLAIPGLIGLFKNPKVLIGLIVGSMAFHLAGIAIFGIDSFFGWLRLLSLFIQSFAQTQYPDWANHLVASVPSAVLMSFPPEQWDRYRGVARVTAAAFLLLATYTQWKVSRSSLDVETRKDLMYIVPMFFLPLASIYFRLNDIVIFVLPAWIAFSKNLRLARIPLLILIVTTDLYVVAQLVPMKFEQAELLLLSAGITTSSLLLAINALRCR